MSGLMGPAILVTLGVLFLLDNFAGGAFDFGRTMPLILVVIGVVKVLQYTAPTDGHIPYGYAAGQVQPPAAVQPAVLPPNNTDQEAPNV